MGAVKALFSAISGKKDKTKDRVKDSISSIDKTRKQITNRGRLLGRSEGNFGTLMTENPVNRVRTTMGA